MPTILAAHVAMVDPYLDDSRDLLLQKKTFILRLKYVTTII